MKVLLPDSISLTPALPDGTRAVTYATREPIPDEHLDAEVLVVWGMSRAHLKHAATSMPNLRLVQSLLAGPDQIMAAGFDAEVAICSGVGLHDITVSEHALALTLALLRHLPTAVRAQQDHRWAKELGGFRDPEGPRESLHGARALIWGFGSIGQTLAPLLRALGADVRGVARSAGERGGFPVITTDELPTALATTDVLVMILPSGPETHHALDAERLSQLQPGALVVNVGRGTTVDETALVTSLTDGHLAGAALDVMETEPLPADSPLWDAPNLLLTPHIAGGRPMGADELIAHNVAALASGGELRNRMERSQ